MKRNMKAIFSTVLAMILLTAVLTLPVIAEEAAATDMAEPADTEFYASFPGQDYIGQSWTDILEGEKHNWGESADVSSLTSTEIRTLSDGTEFIEAVLKDVPQGGTTIDQYYYLSDDKMIACVYKYHIPQDNSASLDQAMQNTNNLYGEPLPFSTASQNSRLLELVSDQAQLQEGMSSWSKPGVNAVMYIDENSQYLIFTVLAQMQDAKNTTVKMSGLSGTEDLTPEEIAMVNTYIDFIQSQVTQQVNQYIDFLKKQRPDAAQQ